MFFCQSSKHSKGTVIMFTNPSLNAEAVEYTTRETGRIMILEARELTTDEVYFCKHHCS